MLCPRCQSDNKPGQLSCWNCLAPLDGALAQRFAQRPPDISAGTAAPKQEGQGFWIGMIVAVFVIMVASMVGFWYMSSSTASSLPDGAKTLLNQQSAPAAASTSTTDNSAGATAGATTATTTTSGATNSGAASTTTGGSVSAVNKATQAAEQ